MKGVLQMSENGKLERLDTREKLAKYAQEHRWVPDDGKTDVLEALQRLSDAEVWHWRENMRFAHNVYQRVGWWGAFAAPRCFEHFLHLSIGDPQKIAYTPSHEYGCQDRQVVTTVGRYLKKFTTGLSDEQIRHWSDVHRSYYGPPVVRFALGADDIQHVYHKGPRSCMGGEEHPPESFSGEYPCRIYDGPDTAVAYLEQDGRVTARTIVRLDRTPMTFIRLYGDATLLRARLERLGFEEDEELSLDGVRLRLSRDGRGRVVAPYLDGMQTVDSSDEDWLVVGRGGDTAGCTDGFTNRANLTICSHCEDEIDPEVTTSAWDDSPICDDCANEYYVYAYCDHRGNEGYVCEDDVAEVKGVWYRAHPDVLESHNIVKNAGGEYRHIDDVVEDVHGEYLDSDEAVYIEEEDAYYPPDEVCTPWNHDGPVPKDNCTLLDDGQYVHNDDLEEFEAQRKLELEAA